MPRDRPDRQHRPDEEVLSTRAAAEAHRLLDMCRKNGIVQAAGRARAQADFEAVGRGHRAGAGRVRDP